jgi:DNA-directed RNA polymerase specialized sigma24 family protein
MPLEGSVTRLIEQVKGGDASAAAKLWERYFRRLVGLARRKLRGTVQLGADEEDIALSTLDSLYRGAADGRFPKLSTRDDLWRLLLVITARKAVDLVQHERAARRGGGKVQGEAALAGLLGTSVEDASFDQIIGREPTPEFAAQVAEECRRLLDLLGNSELRAVAVWKMEGHTNAEIAVKLGCVTVTVERRLRMIRGIWEKERVT